MDLIVTVRAMPDFTGLEGPNPQEQLFIMRRFTVYASVAALEITWSALCIFLLGQSRTDPVVFFEVILFWLIISIQLGRSAKGYAEDKPVYGRFQSKVDSWSRLQREMREEEKERRRYRN